MARDEMPGLSRWHIWLPTVALVASAAMIFLAATAARALEERRSLAIDGRVLGVAHGVEMELRDDGIAAATAILERQLESASGDVVALTLEDPSGDQHSRAGDVARSAAAREVELFVGGGRRSWARGGAEAAAGRGRGGRGGRGPVAALSSTRGRGGRLVLRVHLAGSALRRPLSTRLLLPVTGVFATALFGLALFGASLLLRQRREAQRAAARRRLEALGRAGAGLAHQLRTPLATIKGSSQLAIEEVDAGDPEARSRTRDRLDTVLAQVDRMQRMVGRLLDYARPPQPEPRTLVVADAAREVVDAADLPSGLCVYADPEHVREILEILVDNARKASPPDAPIELSAEAHGERVVLRVGDRGAGPGTDPEHLFEPYVSGHADGTGLGLPIARTLAEANGGSLMLVERAGGGCDAILSLPRSAPS